MSVRQCVQFLTVSPRVHTAGKGYAAAGHATAAEDNRHNVPDSSGCR